MLVVPSTAYKVGFGYELIHALPLRLQINVLRCAYLFFPQGDDCKKVFMAKRHDVSYTAQSMKYTSRRKRERRKHGEDL
ncbi:hypothetical protein D3C78_835650 [compost metagenome]